MNNGLVRNTRFLRTTRAPLHLMHAGIPACGESLAAIANALCEQEIDESVASASPIR